MKNGLTGLLCAGLFLVVVDTMAQAPARLTGTWESTLEGTLWPILLPIQRILISLLPNTKILARTLLVTRM